MKTREWHAVTIILPKESSDIASHNLFEQGSVGLIEKGSNDGTVTFKAYFEADKISPDELKKSIEDGFPSRPIEISITTIKIQNWATDWRQNFKPIEIAPNIIIKPSWEDYNTRPEDIVITLDPGMAFGTGTHETTRLCARALARISHQLPTAAAAKPMSTASRSKKVLNVALATPPRFFLRAPCIHGLIRHLATASGEKCGPTSLILKTDAKGVTMLDIGAGSGILSIIAAKLGAKNVVSVDIDDDALEAAKANILINQCDRVISLNNNINNIHGRFDIVTANILYATLIELKEHIYDRTKNGGYLILSGITTEQEFNILKHYTQPKWQLVEKTCDGEWLCMVLKKY